MKKKLLLFLLTILFLTPWPIVYAHDNAMAGQEPIQVRLAEPSAMPGWQVFGNAIGGIDTPGDLFYIDSTNNSADIVVTLHLTNAEELIHCYRYMILKVGVYIQNDAGEWEWATLWNGEPIPETYITLRNGQVSFVLMGCAQYKLSIDGGSFYSLSTNGGGGNFSPRFYLAVE